MQWSLKKRLVVALCSAVAIPLSACTPSGPALEVREATTSECPSGGKVFTVDGTAHAVCNGTNGTNGMNGAAGAQGATGAAGQSATVTEEPAGANCAAGGIKVQVGSGTPTYVCNGTAGDAGTNGADGQGATITPETAGANCPFGGIKVQVGSGTPAYICNGAPGDAGAPGAPGASTTVTTENPGTNCPAGGVKVQVGSGTPTYVCNGTQGDAGRTPVVTVAPASVTDCPWGGTVTTVDGVATTSCYWPYRTLDALPVGTIVQDGSPRPDGGALLEWRIVNPSDGGTDGVVTLMATKPVTISPIRAVDWDNRWEFSTARAWLNGTFFNELSVPFQAQVTTTQVPWVGVRSDVANTTSVTADKVFLASFTEVGGTPAIAGDGTVFAYFADSNTATARRMEPTTLPWWTRTGHYWGGYQTLAAYLVTSAGGFDTPWATDPYSLVPVINVSGKAQFGALTNRAWRFVPTP